MVIGDAGATTLQRAKMPMILPNLGDVGVFERFLAMNLVIPRKWRAQSMGCSTEFNAQRAGT